MAKTSWSYIMYDRYTFETIYFRSKWESDNSTDVPVKSGNPGYLSGAPVLSGILRADEEASFIVQVVSFEVSDPDPSPKKHES